MAVPQSSRWLGSILQRLRGGCRGLDWDAAFLAAPAAFREFSSRTCTPRSVWITWALIAVACGFLVGFFAGRCSRRPSAAPVCVARDFRGPPALSQLPLPASDVSRPQLTDGRSWHHVDLTALEDIDPAHLAA